MSEKSELTPADRYRNQLEQYHSFRNRIEGPAGQLDMDKAQKRLHDMHTELLKYGEGVGKNQAEVLMDLVLLDGNLAEYDLPDMAVQKIRFDRNFLYYLEFKNGKNVKNKFIGVEIYSVDDAPLFYDANTHKKLPSLESYPAYSAFLKNWIEKPHVFISYYGYWGGEVWAKGTTPAYGLKKERLQAASRDLKVNVFSKSTPSNVPDMHWPLQLTGLVVPYDKLEKTATAISTNKDKYWLTAEETSNLFSPQILEHDDTDQLGEYFGDLSFKMLGIREPRSEDWNGWVSLLNVVAELKKRGANPESIFRGEQEILRNLGSPYIPEIITKEAQKLREKGKKEEARMLESKLEALM